VPIRFSYLMATFISLLVRFSFMHDGHVYLTAGQGLVSCWPAGSVYNFGQLQVTADDIQAAADHVNFAAGQGQFADGQPQFAVSLV
jgi:hypothetical protein